MSLIDSLTWHSKHMRYALGKPRLLGGRAYKIKGYFSDKFCRGDEHEPHLGAVIGELLRRREGAFIDIGVNVGQTLCKLLATGEKRRYIGFEPQIAVLLLCRSVHPQQRHCRCACDPGRAG